VPFNDMDALERAADDSTVGVMLEAIQGESGVNVATETYLRDVQDFCRAKGLLFMLDEVQTGIGRLGTLFGFERWGVEPDVATLAKGLGGGVPIGALLAKESASAFEPGDHGSTFGGNPLMCAVGHAVVSHILDNDILGNVQRVGAHFKKSLDALHKQQPSLITRVRGDGLLLAIDLSVEKAPDVVRFGLDEGVLLNATGPNTLRFAPALNITPAEVDEGIDKLTRALARLEVA
jgi:acetylornithine/succinyldiaminopimelate/putrescine aminotransferase